MKKTFSCASRFTSILAVASAVFAAAPTQAAGPVPPVAGAAKPTVEHVSSSTAAEEDWKGKADTHDFAAGFLTGLGIIDSHAGVSLIGAISRKIVEPGFAPDINNGVSIELEAGPLFVSDGTIVFYSTHLRWDFRKTSDFGLYAIGGFAGYTSSDKLGNPFEFFPRFGIGMLWKIHDAFALRTEASHEVVAVGLHFPL